MSEIYGRARELATEKNINEISVSLSHCKEYAIAHVLLIPNPDKLENQKSEAQNTK